jgi:hypothetical protein
VLFFIQKLKLDTLYFSMLPFFWAVHYFVCSFFSKIVCSAPTIDFFFWPLPVRNIILRSDLLPFRGVLDFCGISCLFYLLFLVCFIFSLREDKTNKKENFFFSLHFLVPQTWKFFAHMLLSF